MKVSFMFKGEVQQKGKKWEVVTVHYVDHLYPNSKFESNSNPELYEYLSIVYYFVYLLMSNVLTSDIVVDPYSSVSIDSLIL